MVKKTKNPGFFLFCFLIAGFWKITQISDYLVFIDFSILTRRSEILWTQDFPASPALKTSPSSAGGVGSIPGWEAEIPHASRLETQTIKQKQYCNKFNQDFKNGPHQKNLKNIYI